MDLILISVRKKLRTKLTNRPVPRSKTGHWHTCRTDTKSTENETGIGITEGNL